LSRATASSSVAVGFADDAGHLDEGFDEAVGMGEKALVQQIDLRLLLELAQIEQFAADLGQQALGDFAEGVHLAAFKVADELSSFGACMDPAEIARDIGQQLAARTVEHVGMPAPQLAQDGGGPRHPAGPTGLGGGGQGLGDPQHIFCCDAHFAADLLGEGRQIDEFEGAAGLAVAQVFEDPPGDGAINPLLQPGAVLGHRRHVGARSAAGIMEIDQPESRDQEAHQWRYGLGFDDIPRTAAGHAGCGLTGRSGIAVKGGVWMI